MKYNSFEIESFIKNPKDEIKAVLFYGPNEGLVFELFNKCAKAIVKDLTDPFLVVDIDPDELSDNPSKIHDEATSVSMMGGRKVLRINGAKNTLTSYLKSYFENPIGDALIVISADNLRPTSTLRKFFEKQKNAIIVPCYEDDEKTISKLIFEKAHEKNKNIEGQAVDFLIQNFGTDRKASLSELEKLFLYKLDETNISLKDVKACVGDSSASSMDDFCYYVSAGQTKETSKTIDKLKSQNIPAMILLRALSNHFIKIQAVKAKIQKGLSFDIALKGVYPPVHFKKKPAFQKSLNIWNDKLIKRALNQIQKAEIDAKKTGFPSDEIASRLFFQLANYASKFNKR